MTTTAQSIPQMVPLWTLVFSVLVAGLGGAFIQRHYDRKKTAKHLKKGNISAEESGGSGDEGEDNDDDDDEDEDSDEPEDAGQIKNKYGIMDAPFKMLLCVSHFKTPRIYHELLIFCGPCLLGL
jgi:hypothetical protein